MFLKKICLHLFYRRKEWNQILRYPGFFNVTKYWDSVLQYIGQIWRYITTLGSFFHRRSILHTLMMRYNSKSKHFTVTSVFWKLWHTCLFWKIPCTQNNSKTKILKFENTNSQLSDILSFQKWFNIRRFFFYFRDWQELLKLRKLSMFSMEFPWN